MRPVFALLAASCVCAGQIKEVSLQWLEEFVGASQRRKPLDEFEGEAVFVGHGIVAPEFVARLRVLRRASAGGSREDGRCFQFRRVLPVRPHGWDFAGLIQMSRFGFLLGTSTANLEKLPAWNPGDEFLAARRRSGVE